MQKKHSTPLTYPDRCVNHGGTSRLLFVNAVWLAFMRRFTSSLVLVGAEHKSPPTSSISTSSMQVGSALRRDAYMNRISTKRNGPQKVACECSGLTSAIHF